MASSWWIFRSRRWIVRSTMAFIVCSMVAMIFSNIRKLHSFLANDSRVFVAQEIRGNKFTVPVFYNLFTANESDAPRVMALVRDQLSNLLPEHRVFAHSIGYPLKVPYTWQLAHHEKGSEMVTLHSVWEYCTVNPESKVVYLHSKGSFHPSTKNDALRSFLTAGALSPECFNLPPACNLCGSRFSPGPHPHIPGNMWLARCSYIRQLMDPSLFEQAMNVANISNPSGLPHCVGRGRYAAEHWVSSHPKAQPCDLSDDPKYILGYYRVPPSDFVRKLYLFPRFERQVYIRPGRCLTSGQHVEDRLREYLELYNETPPPSWWGWKYF